jgi:rod shape-determining protein MreC
MQSGTPPLFRQGIPAKVRFLFFTLLSLLLLLVDSHLRVLEPVRVYVSVFVSPIERVVNAPFEVISLASRFFEGGVGQVKELDRLRSENEALLIQADRTAALLEQNAQLRTLLGLPVDPDVGAAVLVEIKGAVGDRFSRNIVLNRGGNSGIRGGMAVTDSKGLLGQVVRVYPEECELSLITSRGFQTPIQFERTGLRAIAEGVGETDKMRVLYVPANADVVQGDTVITSGIDGVFPRNTKVGVVTSVVRQRGETYAFVELQPQAMIDDGQFARVHLRFTPRARDAYRGQNAARPSQRPSGGSR